MNTLKRRGDEGWAYRGAQSPGEAGRLPGIKVSRVLSLKSVGVCGEVFGTLARRE